MVNAASACWSGHAGPSRRFAPLGGAASLLEEQIGGGLRGLLAFDVGFEPRDLVLEHRNPRVELADREQRQVLTDLVGDFLLWPVVVVGRSHHGPPAFAKKIAAARTVVTPRPAD